MAQLIVRNLESEVVEQLKQLAKQHGRSLESQVRQILKQSVGLQPHEARDISRKWHEELASQKFPDTTELLREDRRR